MPYDQQRTTFGTRRSAINERRTTPRYQFTASTEAIEPHSGVRIAGRTSDLGRGGCYIDTISPFPVGTIITVRINRENQSFKAEGKVVFSQTGMGMGVAFATTDPDQLWTLEKWISELSGEVPKQPEPPEQSEATSRSMDADALYILNELILLLIQKGVLTETEGKSLSHKLLKL
jgi:hypothetical protein